LIVGILGFLAVVVIYGLSGVQTQKARSACNSDARTIETAILAYHANSVTGSWPPAGPIDNTSVLLHPGKPYLPYLLTAPSNAKYYSISTDGLGGVLIAVPPARTGGINYEDAIDGKVAGVKNACDLVH
jgi:hypothetical protein